MTTGEKNTKAIAEAGEIWTPSKMGQKSARKRKGNSDWGRMMAELKKKKKLSTDEVA